MEAGVCLAVGAGQVFGALGFICTGWTGRIPGLEARDASVVESLPCGAGVVALSTWVLVQDPVGERDWMGLAFGSVRVQVT